MEITEIPAERLLEQLNGATIVSSFVEDENGLHLVLQDGRALVICGYFGISIVRQERRELH